MPVTMATTVAVAEAAAVHGPPVLVGLGQLEVARQRRELHRHRAHERESTVPHGGQPAALPAPGARHVVDWAAWCGTTRATGRSTSWPSIQRELERQRVAYTMDGDDLLVEPKVERMVDMIVESITET